MLGCLRRSSRTSSLRLASRAPASSLTPRLHLEQTHRFDRFQHHGSYLQNEELSTSTPLDGASVRLRAPAEIDGGLPSRRQPCFSALSIHPRASLTRLDTAFHHASSPECERVHLETALELSARPPLRRCAAMTPSRARPEPSRPALHLLPSGTNDDGRSSTPADTPVSSKALPAQSPRRSPAPRPPGAGSVTPLDATISNGCGCRSSTGDER